MIYYFYESNEKKKDWKKIQSLCIFLILNKKEFKRSSKQKFPSLKDPIDNKVGRNFNKVPKPN